MRPSELPGRPASLWMETSNAPRRRPLARDMSTDVAVVVAGITGITTALLLKQAGARVAVLEAVSVSSGTTGYTTAKVTSLHRLVYGELLSSFGQEGARAYGEA